MRTIIKAESHRSRLHSDATGSSLVELALTVPIFILLLLGTAEVARFAWAAIEIANAARAGAQYGAVSYTNASSSANIKSAAQNDATDLSGVAVVSSVTCACSSAPATLVACTTICTSPAHILEFVQVNTSATVTPMFQYPGLPSSFKVSGKSIMEIEQ